MREHEKLTSADRELEAALGSLAPSKLQIDPVVAAFLAGRRAGRRQLRIWQSVAAMLLVVSAGIWLTAGTADHFMLVQHPQRTHLRGNAELGDELVAARFSSQSFAVLQAAVREHGLDGLPVVELPSAQLTRIDHRL